MPARLQKVHSLSLLNGTVPYSPFNWGVLWAVVTAEPVQLRLSQPSVRRGSQGDRSKANSAPRPGREGYTTALLLEAGNVLLRKCYDVYPCTRLAVQAS